MDDLAPVKEMLNRMMIDFHRSECERQTKAAQADPKGHKNCLVFPGGGPRFRYYESKTARPGQVTRWAYTSNKNAAGYYLSFIEVWAPKIKRGARTCFIGWKTKAAAIEHCRERLGDARKPPAERRYTIPTYKKITGKHR